MSEIKFNSTRRFFNIVYIIYVFDFSNNPSYSINGLLC